MSKPATLTRLVLCTLDDRTVPSTVSVTSTARPFDFVATGTLSTNDQTTSGTVPLTNTSTSAVKLSGSIDYATSSAGTAATVSLSGTGTGNEVPTNPSNTGGIGAYAQTVTGQWSLMDSNGTVTTGTQPFTGTASYLTSPNTVGSRTVGPVSLAGTFNVSNFQLNVSGNATGTNSTSQDSLTATLTNASNQPTTFAINGQSAGLASDGSVNLNFSVNVTGNLMQAPTETTAVTSVTAEWVGNGQTQSAGVNLPIYWNTGTLTSAITGLTAPSWAQQLVVQVDAAHQVTGDVTTNATWTINLASLTPPASPPVTTTPPVTASPPVTTPPVTASPPTTVSPPVTTSPPPPAAPQTMATASFDLTPGPNPVLEFRDASGQVLTDALTFPGFTGQVNLSVADLNGSGVPDAIISAGAGGGPRVEVIDGATGNLLLNFYAFDPSFRGGVNITATNQTPNGPGEIIAGMGVGGTPQVRVFDASSGALINQFMAYDPSFTGGVNVAAADLNNDGIAEIITGTGAGGGPIVRVFNSQTGQDEQDVLVAPASSRGGVQVSAQTVPGSNQVTVSADPGAAGPIVYFRNQTTANEPLLVNLNNPAAASSTTSSTSSGA